MLKNGLLDNSKPALAMVASLMEIVRDPACDSICIATGYWDLPGTNLLVHALAQHRQSRELELQALSCL